MKFTKGYGERARFTDITIWIRNPRNSRGELLVISWWFHGNLADRNAINRWFSWKSRPVTLYALFFPVHETIIIVGMKKKYLSFSRREFSFSRSRIFINYNSISPRIAIKYANSIEFIFNFRKWSTEEEDNKLKISKNVPLYRFYFPFIRVLIW